MENMDKRLTVSKWVLTFWPKKHQLPQNLSAQFVCPSPKVWGFDEMSVHSPCSNGNDDVYTAWWIHTVRNSRNMRE